MAKIKRVEGGRKAYGLKGWGRHGGLKNDQEQMWDGDIPSNGLPGSIVTP